MADEITPFYRALRLLSVIPRWYFRLRVEGAARVPAEGPCILAANHVSYVDPIVLSIACPRPVRYLVDREQYLRPLVHPVAVRTGAIPVANNPGDFASLRLALSALRQGAVLGIFPEGGRSADGRLMPARPGTAMLALRAGVPLVPAAIVGAFAAYSRHHRFPRPGPIAVRFGAPVSFPPEWGGHAARGHLEEATALVMERISALLG